MAIALANHHHRTGPWMQTASGRRFWPLDPRPEDISIHDIAHALAMQCRYNGHCLDFYSVAEHSVLVSRHAPDEDAMWGLLHDAAEAYVGDLVRALKDVVPDFFDVEDLVQLAICERFGLPDQMPASVRAVDDAILHDEREQLMVQTLHAWNLRHGPLGVRIEALPPRQARNLFLDRFAELGGVL